LETPQANEKLSEGSSLAVKQMASLKIPILKPGSLEPLPVDFSQNSNAIEDLRDLAGGGWILLRAADRLMSLIVEALLNYLSTWVTSGCL
jgi:hypothetical protein